MQHFLGKMFFPLITALLVLSACNDRDSTQSKSSSDWESPVTATGLNTYVIDWACEPKQYGSIAETKIAGQDEYCEWKTQSVTATQKQCRFTTSFDTKRDFYLNSRKKTPFNTIAAARTLVDDCNGIALSRLKANKSVGSLCSGITEGCVAGRNSDPEICDKTRWAVGQKFNKKIEFCVDQLSPRDSIKTPRPLMQFGLLTEIPENCVYSQADHTEVICSIPAEDDCFSVAGQLRPGMRVLTKPIASTAAPLPVFEPSPVGSISPGAGRGTAVSTGTIDEGDTLDLDPTPPLEEITAPAPSPAASVLPSTRECYVTSSY